MQKLPDSSYSHRTPIWDEPDDGISDAGFRALQLEIREQIIRLNGLQKRYRALTGRDYKPFV